MITIRGVPAVIFDVDGVLVDSYAAHRESWCDLAREMDVAYGDAEFAATFGRTSRAILQEHWPPMSDAEMTALDDRKEAMFRAIVERDFPAMPGAAALIDALHAAGWGIAAGSSGPPENVSLALEQLGRADLFGAAITGMDVTRGKPDPEVFLLAAERLGANPNECIVFEDAPAGVAAARAAGMACVGFASTGRTHAELEGADHIIDALVDVGVDQLATILRGRSAP